jgi:hypothetical protein
VEGASVAQSVGPTSGAKCLQSGYFTGELVVRPHELNPVMSPCVARIGDSAPATELLRLPA